MQAANRHDLLPGRKRSMTGVKYDESLILEKQNISILLMIQKALNERAFCDKKQRHCAATWLII